MTALKVKKEKVQKNVWQKQNLNLKIKKIV